MGCALVHVFQVVWMCSVVVWGGFQVVWGGSVCFGVVWGDSTVRGIN